MSLFISPQAILKANRFQDLIVMVRETFSAWYYVLWDKIDTEQMVATVRELSNQAAGGWTHGVAGLPPLWFLGDFPGGESPEGSQSMAPLHLATRWGQNSQQLGFNWALNCWGEEHVCSTAIGQCLDLKFGVESWHWHILATLGSISKRLESELKRWHLWIWKELHSDTMRDRHWAQLMGVTKKTFEKAGAPDVRSKFIRHKRDICGQSESFLLTAPVLRHFHPNQAIAVCISSAQPWKCVSQGPEFSFRHLLELELHHFSPQTQRVVDPWDLGIEIRELTEMQPTWDLGHRFGLIKIHLRYICWHFTWKACYLQFFWVKSWGKKASGMLSTTSWTKASRKPRSPGNRDSSATFRDFGPTT